MTRQISIADRPIGPDHPVYFIAEMSANHMQQFDRAVDLVRAASRAGADAIKLQTYKPDTITIDSNKPYFHLDSGTLWDGQTLYELYDQTCTPWEWHADLQDVAHQEGIAFFSSPFDPSAVSLLEDLDVPAYKVASFELVDLPLLRRIAATGKPIILSTGMATLAEIERAVRTVRDHGADEIAVLRTNSAYPAPPEQMNLRVIPHLEATFGAPVGLSDHTRTIEVAVAAAALGASIIERHLTLSRDLPTADREFSVEPEEFAEMIERVRVTERALGEVSYGPTSQERSSSAHRRSLFVVEDIAAGAPISASNVRSIRPGHGLAPRHYDEVLTMYALGPLERGTPLQWKDIGKPDDG